MFFDTIEPEIEEVTPARTPRIPFPWELREQWRQQLEDDESEAEEATW